MKSTATLAASHEKASSYDINSAQEEAIVSALKKNQQQYSLPQTTDSGLLCPLKTKRSIWQNRNHEVMKNTIFNYQSLYDQLPINRLSSWKDQLPPLIAREFNTERHGNLKQWEQAIKALPAIKDSTIDLKRAVRINGIIDDLTDESLQELHPWRKGPFFINDIHIDTEWRSDWKWDRLIPHISPLKDRTTLDVGCGNGYHCWRMVGEGAKLAIGVDPSPLYTCQFFTMKHFTQNEKAWVIPLPLEKLPAAPGAFDTVFSMGVLYHRKSPIEHIETLKQYIRPKGELVLETLIIDGEEGLSLLPKGRYAKMRNVWFIPTPATMLSWLKRCGFKNPIMVDKSTTTPQEQRKTEWMQFESLSDFLDPKDNTKTLEGYPAPKRAVFIATA